MSAGKNYDTCGLRGGHAYSMITAFNMTDKTGTVYKMFILRDPWGTTDYDLDWYENDPRWTPDMVAQIPEVILMLFHLAYDLIFFVCFFKKNLKKEDILNKKNKYDGEN